jgi:hypothetical protein
MLRALGDGLDVCVTVTLVDGSCFRDPPSTIPSITAVW